MLSDIYKSHYFKSGFTNFKEQSLSSKCGDKKLQVDEEKQTSHLLSCGRDWHLYEISKQYNISKTGFVVVRT